MPSRHSRAPNVEWAPPQLLPERLASVKLQCAACKLWFRPNFFRQLKEPFVPFKPNDTPPDDPGRWIPAATREACPSCGNAVELEIPSTKIGAQCILYGDEAFREYETRAMATYSLVGTDSRILASRVQALADIKRGLAPDRDPSSWAFHMTELWSGQSRRKHPVFASWSSSKCLQAYELLFSVFTSDRPFHIYNIVSRANRATLAQAKRRAYGVLLLLLIDDMTALDAQPQIYFDSERPGSGDAIVHGWATALLNESQHGLLYAFLARGIEIPEPRFVVPASHPCLELADFVSFVVARYYFDRWRGKAPLLDPARLGVARYAGFEPGGDLVFSTQVGYPWEKLHGASICAG